MNERHDFNRSASVRGGGSHELFAPAGAHLTRAVGFVSSGFLVGLLGRFLLGFALGFRQKTGLVIGRNVWSHRMIPRQV
ncbi:MAG TPA: hypothetical protein VMV10_13270 [Pirellulales bacterium]|nr:hypothetical protein [Pirellulales bacterium]